MSKDPKRHHTPEDDPEPGTVGTGEDVCPVCHGSGKQKPTTATATAEDCERCGGTGIIVEGIG